MRPFTQLLPSPDSFRYYRAGSILLQGRKVPQDVTGALVSPGVVAGLQVLLVVVFGIPPLAGRQNLRDDLALPPLLVNELGHFLGDLLLLGVVVEDAGAVLRASVRTLAVQRRGVVHPVEELQEFLVRDFGRVVGYLESFGIWSGKCQHRFIERGGADGGLHTSGVPAAHGAVAWVL